MFKLLKCDDGSGDGLVQAQEVAPVLGILINSSDNITKPNFQANYSPVTRNGKIQWTVQGSNSRCE